MKVFKSHVADVLDAIDINKSYILSFRFFFSV